MLWNGFRPAIFHGSLGKKPQSIKLLRFSCTVCKMYSPNRFFLLQILRKYPIQKMAVVLLYSETPTNLVLFNFNATFWQPPT